MSVRCVRNADAQGRRSLSNVAGADEGGVKERNWRGGGGLSIDENPFYSHYYKRNY